MAEAGLLSIQYSVIVGNFYSGPFDWEITADFFYLQNFCNFFLEFVHLPHEGSEA